jgi:hypothetical protein
MPRNFLHRPLPYILCNRLRSRIPRPTAMGSIAVISPIISKSMRPQRRRSAPGPDLVYSIPQHQCIAAPLSARPSAKEVAQGSLSSLAALPPRRGLGGAAHGNSDYLVGGAARTRAAGKAAGPESGPCATRSDRDFRQGFRSERALNDALHLVIGLRTVGSYKRRDYRSNGA